MAEPDNLNPADRRRLLQALPWYLNGTLEAPERAWVEDTLRRSPWAAQAMAREQALLQSIAAPQPADTDLGMQALLSRVRPTQQRAAALDARRTG